MNKLLTSISTLAAYLLLVSCTSENGEGIPDTPTNPTELGTDRREVTMTLKNTLTLATAGTKAPIATAEENVLTILDLYVFGAETEDGEYTFQERFAYYAPDFHDMIPAGATELILTPGLEDNQISSVLKIKKGLFVKVYAIANSPLLFDPTGLIGKGMGAGGGTIALDAKLMLDTDFVPLTLKEPGTTGTTIAVKGVPTEAEFLTFHDKVLANDNPPTTTPVLPMTGAWTTPMDLRDFSAFARLQAGLKLTRAVARFDIENNAATSKFTITAISMGNARRSLNFFPITPYGSIPAAANERVTMGSSGKFDTASPEYDKDHANKGTVKGAFYHFPSPSADEGYLILKGTYQANLSDAPKNVVYQVPFTQDNGKGVVTSLEINPNHRYTIAITAADDYHVDFDITVADWTDADDINGFEPVEPIVYTVMINQDIADAYAAHIATMTPPLTIAEVPPFSYQSGGDRGDEVDENFKGTSATNKIDAPYTIEVESTQDTQTMMYQGNAIYSYCADKAGSGWRRPTGIELYAMWDKCRGTNQDATDADAASSALGDTFKVDRPYWSASAAAASIAYRTAINFSTGNIYANNGASYMYIRCVRDK